MNAENQDLDEPTLIPGTMLQRGDGIWIIGELWWLVEDPQQIITDIFGRPLISVLCEQAETGERQQRSFGPSNVAAQLGNRP